MGSLVEYCSQQQRPSAITLSPLHLRQQRNCKSDDAPSPDPPSTNCGPWELGLGPEVTSTFEGFELDNNAASFAAVTSSTFFFKMDWASFLHPRNHSGEGWLFGTRISSDLATAAATARLELLPNGK